MSPVTLAPPMRSEQAIFDELAGLCMSPGFVHAIAFLCWRDVVVRFRDEVVGGDIAQMPTPASLIRTEITTLIGLMMRGPIDFAAPEPQTLSRYLERSEQLLAELHEAMLQPAMGILRVHGDTPADLNPFSSGQFLREAIFYGAESAYPFQYCDLAPRKYEADARWLEPISKSFKQYQQGCELHKAQEVVRIVLPARHNTALPLEPGKKALDLPPPRVAT